MRHILFFALAAGTLAPLCLAIVDVNENGVSDLWEKQYNEGGLFPETFDPQADLDADGWTNAQEAAAGTDLFEANPPDGLVRPDIAHVPAVMDEDEWGPHVSTPEAVTVTWPTLVGKQYALLFSADLSEGSWIPVGGSFIGSGNEVEYGFEISGSDKRFWRVAVTDADTDGDRLTDAEEHSIGSSSYLADTDGDGIDDATSHASGADPAGDGSDADGDGIPDNEIYSVVFEVQHEEHLVGDDVGYFPFDSSHHALKRYMTYTSTEEFTITGSPRYLDTQNGRYVNTWSWLSGGAVVDQTWTEEGVNIGAWKQAHPLNLAEAESIFWGSPTSVFDVPTMTATEIENTETRTRPWEVVKDGDTVRSGTETIVETTRLELSDEYDYQSFWEDLVKPSEWVQWDAPWMMGPTQGTDYERYVVGDAAAAESIRENFLTDGFSIFGNIAYPRTFRNYDYGRDIRLKSVRWRWVRFNPSNPFDYEYAAPPAPLTKHFHLLVQQETDLYDRYDRGSLPLYSNSSDKGAISIECRSDHGGSNWQSVPLSIFNAFKIEDPDNLAEIDFTKSGGSHVRFSSLEFRMIPAGQTAVSADDHLTHVVVKMPTAPDGCTIEWEIESGIGGQLAEAETSVENGYATNTLTTSTVKGATYIIKTRIKKMSDDGEDISAASDWIRTTAIKVIAGRPHDFTFATTKSSYHSDGTDTAEITATIKDQYGNLVEDDTPVSWTVALCPTPPFVSMDDATVDGIAKAVLKAPLIPDDQIVTCSAGDKQKNTTVAVQGVTGSLAGNVNLDIGTAQQSTMTVSAQAADGTPVYWTSSNGEITAQSTIGSGAATATLKATGGRLGKVVVTATVGDHLFYIEGQFSSTAGLAIGADHPVLIANATADGSHTPTFAHGIARQIPFYASTAIRIKGPPSGLAHLTIEASVAVGSWSFDEAVGMITPSENGPLGMTLTNAAIDEVVQHSGAGSLLFDGNASGSVADSPEFHFTNQFNASVWLRPSEVTAATFAGKSGSWHIGQLADGRVQASVTTDTGTHVATTTSPLALNQWTLLVVDFRFNRLQIKLDNGTAGTCATTGNIVITTSGIEVGAGFDGNMDNLTLRAGGDPASHVTLAGLAAGNTLQLDMIGEASFTVTSTGTSNGDTSIRIFSKVNPEAETEVTLVDPGIWDYTYDTVASFIGGDPSTNAGTVSSIAGGFLVVGDIGSCTKNLWRMAGWSDKKPNYIELSLGGLGILTTFAEVTVVGAPVDAGVASVKTLAIRFGSNPKAIKFLTVFIEQIKNFLVGSGRFGWAEANFLKKMVTDIPVSDACKLFMHDDGLARAAIYATEKLGANAESFYQATRRAVTAHGEETAKKFV